MKSDREIGDTEPAMTVTLSEDQPLPAQTSAATLASSEHYEVEGEHARGGLGRVLRAWDRRLNRPVALKEALQKRSENSRRFEREVEITARLQHPNIVPVYEAGHWPNGTPFYAMKFVSGRTLRQLIEEAAALDLRLALLPNVLAVADAVAYAHSEGVIHRDLKPSNVLIGSFGETVVVDWGLAKDTRARSNAADGDAGPYRAPANDHTEAGAVLGTASYMPPEQARGGEVDTRADVYAIGAILYTVLAGRAPYSGDATAKVLERVIAGPPAAVEALEPGVPLDLATIVRKAMARGLEERYPSAQALADDLRRFLTGQLVGAHRYSRAFLLRRMLRRHRSAVAVAVPLLAVLTASMIVSIRRIIRERDAARVERALAEDRAHALTLTQARTSLEVDPTAALAWLKSYPATATDQQAAHDIAADAMSRGVARAVLHARRNVSAAALSPDGMQVAGGGEGVALDWWPEPGQPPRALEFKTTATSMVFSPDRRLLAAGGEYGRLAIWNLADGVRRDLSGHERGVITQLAFSPDGTTLLSSDATGRVCFWDLPRTTKCEPLDFPHATMTLSFSADGTPLAFVAMGRQLAQWDARARRRRVIATHDGDVDLVAASVHGEVVFTRAGKRLYAWSVAAGRRIGDMPVRSDPLFVVVSPDGRRCAYWHFDHSVVIYDLSTHAVRSFELPQQARFGVFSPDGEQLAVSMVGGAVALRDVSSGDSQLLLGHSGLISALEFSRDGATLMSAGLEEGTIRLWPVHHLGRVLQGDGGMLLTLAFSRDGRTLAGAGNGGIVNVWTTDGRLLRTVAHTDLVQSIDFSPDGRWLASASWDGTARWINLEDGRTGALVHDARVQRVVWLDDGKTLATAAMDGTISRWTVADARRVVLGKHDGPVHVLELSRDRSSMLTAGDDGTVRSWPLDGRPPRVVARHGGAALARFLPDGRTGVSVGTDGTARLWSIDGAWSRSLRSGGSPLLSLAVSADGNEIAAGCRNGELELWTLPDGTLRVLRGHQAKINSVAFSPDGRQVAATGYDHMTRVWSLPDGDAATLRGHEGHVVAVAYSPDSQSLATAGVDSTVHFWSRREVLLVPADGARFQQWLSSATNDVVSTTAVSRGARQ